MKRRSSQAPREADGLSRGREGGPRGAWGSGERICEVGPFRVIPNGGSLAISLAEVPLRADCCFKGEVFRMGGSSCPAHSSAHLLQIWESCSSIPDSRNEGGGMEAKARPNILITGGCTCKDPRDSRNGV